MQNMLRRQYDHKGTAFLEVYQNCLIFNDGAFKHLSEKELIDDNVLFLVAQQTDDFWQRKE